MENTYDRKEFFEKYSQMERSVKGLEGAGEWHELQKLLPDFSGKRVLDLGCGFGWYIPSFKSRPTSGFTTHWEMPEHISTYGTKSRDRQ